MAGPSSAAHFVDMDEDEDQGLAFYGSFRSQIVGIQYYTGVVNKNEMVTLTREPQNPYDRWAIRVDNVRGVKVGHLKREVVCHLAPLIDQGQLKIEGVVPGGTDNKYTMPVSINCFGPAASKDSVIKRLRTGYINMEITSWEEAENGGENAETSSAKMPTEMLEASLDRLFEDLLNQGGVQEMMRPVPEVLSRLYPHQMVALAWMVRRENSSSLPPFWEPHAKRGATAESLQYVCTLTNYISSTRPAPLRGGILADDMGLGKTLSIISLIASNRPGVMLPSTFVQQDLTDERPKKKRKGEGKVTMPASFMAQTQAQAKTKAFKLAAQVEPPAQPPAAGGPKGTLIVCPLSVLSNWVTQIAEHTAGNLKVYVFHGQSRETSPAFLAEQDVVVTTYATLATEVNSEGVPHKKGLLHVDWLRVVLDEAHTIKNPNALQSKAARAVKAERRWAITGTPIQNKMQDMYGLMSFLKLEPLHDRALFVRTIERAIRSGDPRGLMRVQVLMGNIAIRRTKDLQVDGKPIVDIPSKTINICSVRLDREDQLKYDRWELEARRIISLHLRESTLLANYVTVLQMILRLRQICDHGDMCPEDDLPSAPVTGRAATPELLSKLLSIIQSGSNECAICLSEMELPTITVCGHAFCRRCIELVIARDKPSCPMCRAHVTAADLFDPPADALESSQDSLTPAGSRLGAKVAALMAHLKLACSQSQPGEPPIKSIVFSQFTGMLGLAAKACQQEGLSFLRLDGKSSANARSEMLKAFASSAPDSPTVFLISLKAGGVGLNLTSASRVHLLDPWWNPAVEEQAMDRVHRLGQTRPVEVYRYVAEDTIEERMLQLQEKKRELAKAAFDRKNPDQQRQMRIDDVKLLMAL